MIMTTVIKWVSLHNSMSLEVTENKARWLGGTRLQGIWPATQRRPMISEPGNARDKSSIWKRWDSERRVKRGAGCGGKGGIYLGWRAGWGLGAGKVGGERVRQSSGQERWEPAKCGGGGKEGKDKRHFPEKNREKLVTDSILWIDSNLRS